jgi:hypothetical protein
MSLVIGAFIAEMRAASKLHRPACGEAMHPLTSKVRYRLVNRGFSALLLSGLGAGALYAVVAAQPPEQEPSADPAAVDRYLAQLSESVPPPVATKLAREQVPTDPTMAKDIAKADRAEPMVGAAFAVVR